MQIYYVYVLLSLKDSKKYTGYTKNLKLRFEQHNNGLVKSIKNRKPLKLIYFEGCFKLTNSTHRDKHLKRHYGRIYL